MAKLKSSAKVWPLTFNFEFKEPKYFTPTTGTSAKLDRIRLDKEDGTYTEVHLEVGEVDEPAEIEQLSGNGNDSEEEKDGSDSDDEYDFDKAMDDEGRKSAGAVEKKIEIDQFATSAVDDLLGGDDEPERGTVSMGALQEDLINLNPFESAEERQPTPTKE